MARSIHSPSFTAQMVGLIKRIPQWGWILTGLVIVHLAPMWWGYTLIFGDNYSLLVPGKIFTAFWMRQGIVPFWNPYLFAGINWIGDITQSVMYPSTLIFALFNPALALNITVAAHVLFSGVGAFLLARNWRRSPVAAMVSAAVWMLSTQLTGSINNLATIQSLAWLPWVVLVGQQVPRRVGAKYWLALLVTGQFLAGYPQHVLYGLVFAVICSLYLSWQPSFLKAKSFTQTWLPWGWSWLQAAVWVVVLSAVAWLPFVPTLLSSTRLEQSAEQAAMGSLHPAMLAKAVLPFIFDKPLAGMKWGPAWSGQPNMVFYAGWLGWLVIAGRLSQALVALPQLVKKTTAKKWWHEWAEDAWWLVILLVTVLVALGDRLPGFTALQQALPFFKIGRYPSMILIITHLALAIWVGGAFQKTMALKPKISYWLISALAAVAASAAGLWLAVSTVFDQLWPAVDAAMGNRLSSSAFHTLARDQVIGQVLFSDLAVTAALATAGLWLLRQRRWTLVIALLCADLLYHMSGQFIWAPTRIYPSWSEIEQQHGKLFDQPVDPQVRYLTRNGNQPYTDFGSYWEALIVRAPFSDSFVDDAELRSFAHPIRLRDGLTPNWQMVYGVPVIHGYTSMLPSDYAAYWQDSKPTAAGKQPARINFIPYVNLDNPELERWGVGYYLVDNWFSVQPSEQLSELPLVVKKNTLSLHQLAPASRFRFDDGTQAVVEKYQQTPNRLSFTVMVQPHHNHLIIADRYEPGWQAKVNGRTGIVTAAASQRQIAVQPGLNQIELVYQPTYWYFGLAISCLGALVLTLLKPWRIHILVRLKN